MVNLQTAPIGQVAALQIAITESSQSLDSTQLQALPLSGRNWQSFVLDSPAQADQACDGRGPSAAAAIAPQLTVDGARLQSAFGSISAGRNRKGTSDLISPGAAESALRDVQPGDFGGTSAHAVPSQTIVATQRGSDHLHGQAFVFDRQNLWNARNPFTQWIQETTTATTTTIPVFTAESYTPGDREALWGAGIGGVIHKPHLFWFAALDGYERYDPGVATI
jgi:hypothetical protein